MPDVGQDPLMVKRRWRDLVNAERDQRVSMGFYVGEAHFEWDAKSRAAIFEAATLAGWAISQGSQVGDMHWHGGTEPFAWTLSDDSELPLDAFAMQEVAKAGRLHEDQHVKAARALKRDPERPAKFNAKRYWPEQPKTTKRAALTALKGMK